ncbi:Putative UmuC domain, DNA polymerase, Y-family, little finger domain, DNA/RNA polymerase superfamily [Colletotrichum destructivum]|uniref:DNA polymerase eta n=1 Tax=Colletotrichum destructivum TaxID=34406 RepID=A0AAX4J1G8_9PEZI|nr:Putative UmuC domain, DNA polymerase, Y-family, little finger domain, DNA/RNA polymerase superfamily [Colletotrichum destructivum]
MCTPNVALPADSADPMAACSQFTHYDLHLLAQSSPESPLRVVALVDYDSFYAQYEAVRLGLPASQPLAVRQWNAIIALNYPAKQHGLKRGISVDEARRLCPGITIQHIPTWREGDGQWSVDEFYLDLSTQVYRTLLDRFPDITSDTISTQKLPLPAVQNPLNWQTDRVMNPPERGDHGESPDWDDVALSVGADIVRNIREHIKQRLRLTTSAGVSHNKLLAKVPLATMITQLGSEQGHRVFAAIRGADKGAVVPRCQVQSLLSAKTFVPPVESLQQASKWLRIFAADLEARLHDLDVSSDLPRRPKTIAVHHHVRGRFGPTRSKQAPIALQSMINQDTIFDLSYALLTALTADGESWPCQSISVSLFNMESRAPGKGRITSFFAPSAVHSSQRRRRSSSGPETNVENERKKKMRSSIGHLESAETSDTSTISVVDGRGTSSGVSTSPSLPWRDSQYECPLCNGSVEPENVLEHLDWHVAEQIQHQENEPMR